LILTPAFQLLAQVLSLPSLTAHVDSHLLLDRLLSLLNAYLPQLRTSHPALSEGRQVSAEPTEKEARSVVLAALQQLVSLTQRVDELPHAKKQVTAAMLLSKLLPLTLELLVCLDCAIHHQ
jgi:hypothetical protein